MDAGVIPIVLNPIISAGAGLLGVLVGGYMSDRRERQKRRGDFITRQLTEFYGPLVAGRAEILARSDLRVKVEQATSAAWPNMVAEARDAISRAIDYDNTILRETLIPAYHQMVATFREKWSLAEPKTRTYFAALVEFVEIWERHLKGGISGEAIARLGHTEENLKPFYAHLEATHEQLRRRLSGE
jgi:hypothetical protein